MKFLIYRCDECEQDFGGEALMVSGLDKEENHYCSYKCLIRHVSRSAFADESKALKQIAADIREEQQQTITDEDLPF